jgi:hypothetical protein
MVTQFGLPHSNTKKDEDVTAKDFHPISCVHSFAKLITKIMANRLAPLLNSLVATNQSAFICGRCMHNNFMLVQQTIKLHRKKVPSLFLKLDTSKALDSVVWLFLMEILNLLGFGSRWKTLVAGLFSSASTRIFINGQPRDMIRH